MFRYDISITPQNEEQRSLIFNILHGNPEGYMTMPIELIECALILLNKSFEDSVQNQAGAEPGHGGESSNSDILPIEMQLLLDFITEKRQLTTEEYEQLIEYLLEMHENEYQYEQDELQLQNN